MKELSLLEEMEVCELEDRIEFVAPDRCAKDNKKIEAVYSLT